MKYIFVLLAVFALYLLSFRFTLTDLQRVGLCIVALVIGLHSWGKK